MYFRAIAGMVAGLCAGVISGIMFLMMHVPEPDGMTYTVLTFFARAAGSNDPAIGWSYHLFNSAILGILFGLFVGKAVTRLVSAISFGFVASLVLWGLANLILLPQFRDDVMGFSGSPVSTFGLATLIGYAVQGILLGVIFLWVYNPIAVAESREATQKPRSKRVAKRSGSSAGR